jgi:hypothetical protein
MNFLTLLQICSTCPLGDELDSIPSSDCPVNMGQIQRYFFAKKGEVIWDSVTPANNIPATLANEVIEDATGWNILFTATGALSGKTIYTPLIGGDSSITAGSELTEGGGDNTTLSGVILSNGTNPADGQARFDGLKSDQIAPFRKLNCEDIEVYFVNQSNKIIARKQGATITGFPLKKFYFGTKDNAGLNSRDSNLMTFQLNSDYDEFLHVVNPTFNALTVKV